MSSPASNPDAASQEAVGKFKQLTVKAGLRFPSRGCHASLDGSPMGELGPKSRPEFENYHVLPGEAAPAGPWLGGKAQTGIWTTGTVLCWRTAY